MVALYPPAAVAGALYRPGGIEVDDLHCTVAYLGKTVDVDLEAVLAAVTPLAARPPIEATVGGHGRFTGDPEQDVLVALVDAPALERLRRDLVDALTGAGITIPSEHGYTAHITLTYLDSDTPDGVHRLHPTPVTFPALTVKHGTQRIDLLFGGDPAAEAIVPYARTAYAQGWAASGGPMTDTVRAGCIAAIEHAIEHAHDPTVLEVTLRLGHLEGTWAAVYDRRERIYNEHLGPIKTAWRAAARRLDLSTAISRFRASVGLTEETQAEDDARAKDHRTLVAKAIAAAVLHAIASPEDASPDARDPIIHAIADALKAADAEGWAGAVAVSADKAGLIGIDFNLAFADAWKALGELDTYWAQAAGWLGEITKGLQHTLGAELVRLSGEGASYSDMIDAAEQILTGVDLGTVATVVDMAMAQSFSRGALTLYQREGVREIDYLTAGGARVCKRCEDYESKNPWPIDDVPHPAVHPHCRCALAASNPLQALDTLTTYATGGGAK